jgi:hypothetical protein
MIVQVGGQRVSVQVQSSGFARASAAVREAFAAQVAAEAAEAAAQTAQGLSEAARDEAVAAAASADVQASVGFVTLQEIALEADAMPRIQTALASHDRVLLIGSFTIASVYGSLLTGKEIMGIRGQTTLTIDAALTSGIVFDLGVESTMQDITINGPLAAPDVNDDTDIYTVDTALANTGVGSLSLVKIRTQSSKVLNCELTGAPAWAIETSKNNVAPNGYAVDGRVSGCRIYGNWGGIKVPEESEYLTFSDNWICWNVIGVDKAGGNNLFADNHIDHNRVNFITRGGLNNSHGAITGGTLNHGKLAVLISDSITVGEAISGVNMFDGGDLGIYVRNSMGLNVTGCLLGRINIYCEGISTEDAANPGVNVFINNTFNLHGATYQIYRNWLPTDDTTSNTVGTSSTATPDNCKFRLNQHMEGDAAVDGSSWSPTILNDPDVPDMDGFRAGTTVEGATNSRYVRGCPVDGGKFVGTVTGALAITLPVASFNNSLCTFKISVSTSNGRGATFEFDAYALSGGSWSGLVEKVIGGDYYKVRLGRNSDDKPVIYIGELATGWTNAFVRVDEVFMHQGAWALARYWRRGWEIGTEASAFENVTQTAADEPASSTSNPASAVDLNTIAVNTKAWSSGASNRPGGALAGTAITEIGSSTNFRTQTYHDATNNVRYARSTTTGDAGYKRWTPGRAFTATVDPASLAAGASTTIATVAVTGAALGDSVENLAFTNNLAGVRITAWVSATNTVSYYFTNVNATDPIDLASGTLSGRHVPAPGT